MNSLDPWRAILTTLDGGVVVPTASYGHPLYQVVPSWIPYGRGNGARRVLFDGAFIGADAPARQRGELTAEVAPVVAPATGGVSVRKELDAKQVLHVEVCVDGKCYSTSMDLAPAIALILGKLAQWHRDQHAQADQKVAPAVVGGVVGAVDAAVGAAVHTIAGELVARHVDCACAGWLSDIGNLAKKAALGPLAPIAEFGPVKTVLNKFKGPISAAAGMAAAAGATMIPGVGPLAAPLAGKLANDLVHSTLGESAAQKRVAQATRRAADDPATAAALAAAQKAVANSTVAHYVQDTAKRAASGDSAAQRKIVDVAQDVEKGDPAAKAVADLIANAMKSEWGAKLWEQVTGRGPSVSGWYDLVGAWPEIDASIGAVYETPRGAKLADVRRRAAELASAKVAPAVGVIHAKKDNTWYIHAFATLDDAIDWLQGATRDRASFTYAAAFEKGPDGAAYVQGEEVGGSRRPAAPLAEQIRREVATVGG